MTEILYVIDEKGRKVAVQIDLKKYGTIWKDFRERLLLESCRKEKTVSYERYRAVRAKLPVRVD